MSPTAEPAGTTSYQGITWKDSFEQREAGVHEWRARASSTLWSGVLTGNVDLLAVEPPNSVGLDTEATRIGDVLWNGEDLDEAAQQRVVGLFRLTFRDPGAALDKVKGEPVFLILAMDQEKMLRIKPQNLLTGLPIKHLEAVA